MFFPQLFGIVGEKLIYTKDHQYDDPEDLYDDRYLLEVRTCTHMRLDITTTTTTKALFQHGKNTSTVEPLLTDTSLLWTVYLVLRNENSYNLYLYTMNTSVMQTLWSVLTYSRNSGSLIWKT